MSSIVLSAAVRQNLLALQNTASLMATTQNDLATGNKVNSALDNPTNFFTAAGLNNRATDISNLLDGISNGVQVLQAANSGITSLESLVSQAKSIANQALQTSIGYSTKSSITSSAVAGATASNLLGTTTYANGSFTGAVITNDKSSSPPTVSGATALTASTSADSLATSIGSSDTLTVNGQTITFAAGAGTNSYSATGATIYLGGANANVGAIITAVNTITGSTTASIASGQLSFATGTTASGVTIGGTANALSALGLSSGGSSTSVGSSSVTSLSTSGTALVGTGTTALGANNVLSFAATGGGTATTITFGTNTGAGQVQTLDQLNTALAADNLQATLNTTTGALTITTTNDAASSTIGTVGGSARSTSGGIFYSSSTPVAPVSDATSQATRANLVSQYNAILTQIDNTASDASYNGVNLLNGDQLQLTFNETGKSKVNITGVNFSSAGLGLSSLVSGTDFIDNSATNKVLNTLNNVSSELRSQASAFGSNLSVVQTRQDFNKSLINVLQTGSANLTQADINEEAANSQALSTRQSLSVSALSLANQAQQSVLQLLR